MLLLPFIDLEYNKKTKKYKAVFENGTLEGTYKFWMIFFTRSNNFNLNVRYFDE